MIFRGHVSLSFPGSTYTPKGSFKEHLLEIIIDHFFKVDYGYIYIYDLYINNEPLETLDVGIYIYIICWMMDIFIMYGIHGDQCEIWALSYTVLTRQYLITDSSRIQFQHPRSRQDVVSFLATKTGSVTLLDFVRADIEKSGPNMFLLNHLLVLFISISRMTSYYNLQTSLALE